MKRLAVTAFNRVLELNHKHSTARYKAGAYLLNNIKDSFTISHAFSQIADAA